jgi:hypothetical protein
MVLGFSTTLFALNSIYWRPSLFLKRGITMSKIDLFSVLELLESGDEAAAKEAIHEWLVGLGQTAQVTEVVTEGNDANWEGEEVHADDLEDEGDEAGEGGHVSVDVDNATPSPENRDPEKAQAVEINAEEHHGYDLEASPEVKNAPGPHFVDFDLGDLDEISKEGDSGALLNSGEGFGSDSPASPIAGEEGSSEKAPAKKSAPKTDEPKADEPKEEPAKDESEEEEKEEKDDEEK